MRRYFDIVCQRCGTTFKVEPRREHTARYCSRECRNAIGLAKANANPTHKIGNTFRKGLRPSNAFTTEQVRGSQNPRWVEPLDFVCQNCGTTFYRKPWEVRKSTPTYCSKTCRNEYRRVNESGKASRFWVGGPKTYRGKGWKDARAIVVQRDNGACQDCGRVVGDAIPVHHIRPFREFDNIEEANAPANLICLCQSCHMKREYLQQDTLITKPFLK